MSVVTSQRTGLPVPRYQNAIKTHTTAPAAPDMTSQASASINVAGTQEFSDAVQYYSQSSGTRG